MIWLARKVCGGEHLDFYIFASQMVACQNHLLFKECEANGKKRWQDEHLCDIAMDRQQAFCFCFKWNTCKMNEISPFKDLGMRNLKIYLVKSSRVCVLTG